jgi:hypothetical protein
MHSETASVSLDALITSMPRETPSVPLNAMFTYMPRETPSVPLNALFTYMPRETPSVPLNALFTYMPSVPRTGYWIGPKYEEERKLQRLYWVKRVRFFFVCKMENSNITFRQCMIFTNDALATKSQWDINATMRYVQLIQSELEVLSWIALNCLIIHECYHNKQHSWIISSV